MSDASAGMHANVARARKAFLFIGDSGSERNSFFPKEQKNVVFDNFSEWLRTDRKASAASLEKKEVLYANERSSRFTSVVHAYYPSERGGRREHAHPGGDGQGHPALDPEYNDFGKRSSEVIGERAKGHRGVACRGAIDLSFPPGSAFDTLGESFIRRFASPPSLKVRQPITGRPLLSTFFSRDLPTGKGRRQITDSKLERESNASPVQIHQVPVLQQDFVRRCFGECYTVELSYKLELSRLN
ncbi:hypothetical protein HNY73_021080 [Argiope bruennichi]|uniref:Uncharacterized protein n=1 Tax=Argiope bruennichi TaxID=94029 RepID=A0A8T0EA82_ARGBR|nr:hypothetical protein HNY73_021080 [Argiope bruennichi]